MVPKIFQVILVMVSFLYSDDIQRYLKSRYPDSCDIKVGRHVGELKGDKSQQIVFNATIECGQEVYHTFGISENRNGMYVVKQVIDTLEWIYSDSISITKGIIRVAGFRNGPNDGACCPTVKMEKFYSWTGDSLVDETAQRHSGKYQSKGFISAEDEIKERLDSLNAERFKYLSYNITGQVIQIESGVGILWGTATRQYSYGSAGTYQPGELLDDGYISILKLDPNLVPRNNIYSGTHCFVKKIPSRDKIGRNIWVYIYGSCPSGKAKLDRQIKNLIEAK